MPRGLSGQPKTRVGAPLLSLFTGVMTSIVGIYPKEDLVNSLMLVITRSYHRNIGSEPMPYHNLNTGSFASVSEVE